MSIRVAIVGVGNCASAFLQGLYHYQTKTDGLISKQVGMYKVEDIRVVAAFDVDKSKVGSSLGSAHRAGQNNTIQFSPVPGYCKDVAVVRGPTLDGLGLYLKDVVEESTAPAVNVVEVLKHAKVEVLVNYLPVGSQTATEYYAGAALEAGCAFVNCIPVFVASNPAWASKFSTANLPIVGDDIKSQFGATILHRSLVRMLGDRGVKITNTYQLNFGGNTDFLNMLERSRLDSKKISKTNAVTSQLGTPLPARNVHVGPSDYVPFLEDRKYCHVLVEAEGFGGTPIRLDVKLEVWDSPNSAGVVTDAVRYAKIALDRGVAGPVHPACSWLMKSPPIQRPDEVAMQMCEEFARGADSGREGV